MFKGYQQNTSNWSKIFLVTRDEMFRVPQRVFAKKLGMRQARLCEIETGSICPNKGDIEKFVKLLNTYVEEL